MAKGEKGGETKEPKEFVQLNVPVSKRLKKAIIDVAFEQGVSRRQWIARALWKAIKAERGPQEEPET